MSPASADENAGSERCDLTARDILSRRFLFPKDATSYWQCHFQIGGTIAIYTLTSEIRAAGKTIAEVSLD